MIEIIIADDHTIVREGLKQILSGVLEMNVCAEAANGPEVIEKLRKHRCDVVLLDISMPGRGGLETLKEIKTEFPKVAVLILSMFPEDQYAVRCLKSGASGYMTKESAPDQLVTAIRKVATGGKYVSSAVAERLVFELDHATDRPLHESLSDREFQIMKLIASGKTVKEIADELALSVKTISTYRTRVLQKMKLRNNAQLTHYAVERGLV